MAKHVKGSIKVCAGGGCFLRTCSLFAVGALPALIGTRQGTGSMDAGLVADHFHSIAGISCVRVKADTAAVQLRSLRHLLWCHLVTGVLCGELHQLCGEALQDAAMRAACGLMEDL